MSYIITKRGYLSTMERLLVFLGFVKRHILLVILVLLMFSALDTVVRNLRRGDVLEEAEKRLEEARVEQENLLGEKERVGSVEFIEKEARDKLGLSRSGEIVVVLPSTEVLRRYAPSDQEDEVFLEALSVWRRWVRLFLPNLEGALLKGKSS